MIKKGDTAVSVKSTSLWHFLSWRLVSEQPFYMRSTSSTRMQPKVCKKTTSERLVLLNASDITFRQALLSCKALECMKCNIIFWHSAQCFLTVWFLAYLHVCFGGIVRITVLLYVCDEWLTKCQNVKATGKYSFNCLNIFSVQLQWCAVQATACPPLCWTLVLVRPT